MFDDGCRIAVVRQSSMCSEGWCGWWWQREGEKASYAHCAGAWLPRQEGV